MNVFVLAVVFHWHFQETGNFRQNCWFFGIWRWNTTVSMENFTEKNLGHNSKLHINSHLSLSLSKILPYSKTIKNAKKLLVFGENDSRCLSNFLQTHIFWNFDYISRTYNQITNSWWHTCFFRNFFRKISSL